MRAVVMTLPSTSGNTWRSHGPHAKTNAPPESAPPSRVAFCSVQPAAAPGIARAGRIVPPFRSNVSVMAMMASRAFNKPALTSRNPTPTPSKPTCG
jgi:hypothetical protein